MKTSIIIIASKENNHIIECISSIERHTIETDFEVIVLVQESNREIKENLNDEHNVSIIFYNDNLINKCNQAIKQAIGDNLVFLYDRIIVTCDWLKNLLSYLNSSKQNGIVAPSFINQMRYNYKTDWNEVLNIKEYCFVVKHEVFDKIGLFDERFFNYSSAVTDFTIRTRKKEYKIFVSKDKIVKDIINENEFGNQIENNIIFSDKWGFKKVDLDCRYDIVQLINNEKKLENSKIMEIGCQAGSTLLELKNIMPDSQLYGVEKNKNIVINTKYFANIKIGGLEKLYEYPKNYFDYILVNYDNITNQELENVISQVNNYINIKGELIITLPLRFNIQSIVNNKRIQQLLIFYKQKLYKGESNFILCLKNNKEFDIDTKKISFISYVDNEELYNKSLSHIQKLKIPKGYEVECISIKNVKGMTFAYNKALISTNSKYKVFLQQDVMINNTNFIKDFLTIFSNKKIGMIGVIGTKQLPNTCLWWESDDIYGKIIDNHKGENKLLQYKEVENEYENVEMINGKIMITQYNIPWRQDLFDGWQYYDIAQCQEFIKSGYKIVIPKQKIAWCNIQKQIINKALYDGEKVNSINEYNRYYNIIMNRNKPVNDIDDNAESNIKDDNKICFICCVEDEKMARKSLGCIKNLLVPNGYKIQCVFMKNTNSITEGYNFAQNNSDAKYKVYLKDNLLINNKEFLFDVLDIFNKYKSIGMIGVKGFKNSGDIYGKLIDTHTGKKKVYEYKEISNIIENVDFITDFIMITQYDLLWKEYKINGCNLYNITHCIEYKKAGYEIIVPKQKQPWCFYACGINNEIDEFEKYRQKFISEYNNKNSQYNNKSKRKKTFVTLLLPSIKNVHLLKDAGMIPYIMYKYYGYDSKIVVSKGGKFPYINNEVKGLKLDFIETSNNPDVDGYNYLKKNAKTIDVLQLYYLNSQTLNWVRIYKNLNPNGKVYIKGDLDFSCKVIDFNIEFDIDSVKLLKNCDLISVETKDMFTYINSNWPVHVEYIPNGYYSKDYEDKQIVQYKEKQNVICTVGRLGTYQKNTELLLEAFALIARRIDGWKLRLIGPVQEEFNNFIEEFFIKYPELRERITFVGELIDREELDAEYKKAKIFCLPSRWESFGIVLVEAISKGCYTIISDIEAAYDITNDEEYGDIFIQNNVDSLAISLLKAVHDENKLEQVCYDVQEYAFDKFNWINICKKINDFLNKSKDK